MYQTNVSFPLQEGTYEKAMNQTVLPFLQEKRVEEYLGIDATRQLYCCHYLSDTPRAVVLISHGFTETADKYQEMIWYFLQKGYHVYVPEHCGHGRSYRLTQNPCMVHVDRFDRYVADLAYIAGEIRERHSDLPLYLYAHSMGGGIGAVLVKKEPKLFNKVILSSPMVCPATGEIPTGLADVIVHILCVLGRKKKYAPGQHDYTPSETFEESASSSLARFQWYQRIRKTTPAFQMSGASCGWLREAFHMRQFLLKPLTDQAEKEETTESEVSKECTSPLPPVLIFQAGKDAYVLPEDQRKLISILPGSCMIRIENAKHELFNAPTPELELYLREIFLFFDENPQ